MKSTSAAVTLMSLGLAITACSAGSGTSSEEGTGGTAGWEAGTGGAVGQPSGGSPAGGTTVTGGGSGGTVSPSGGSPADATGGSITGQGGSTGGSPASGGQPASGGSTVGSGGTDATGGVTSGGTTSAGGTNGSDTGGTTATGGAGTGGAGTGGDEATGGVGTGGDEATGGVGTGGDVATGGVGTGGDVATAGAGGDAATGGAGTVDGPDCSAAMPSGGVTVDLTSWINGQAADGLSYGGWTNGNGGTITYFPDAHAFAASWNNSENYLAHLGLDFDGSRPYTDYGTIIAEFVENKYGDAGGFSMIGMYGWTHNPCVEWYIDEDSYHGLWGRGDVTATIDGATYYLRSNETTGTDGANACESGHTGPWTQMHSTREAARNCGIITVSDHFNAWAAQGWNLGNLTSVHINVEVGGGVGSIEFPVANVTTSN